MKYNLYTIKDAASRFMFPMAIESDPLAIRTFVNALRSDEMKNDKKDYDLYQIGTYDSDRGVVVPCEHRCVCFGSSYIFEREE